MASDKEIADFLTWLNSQPAAEQGPALEAALAKNPDVTVDRVASVTGASVADTESALQRLAPNAQQATHGEDAAVSLGNLGIKTAQKAIAAQKDVTTQESVTVQNQAGQPNYGTAGLQGTPHNNGETEGFQKDADGNFLKDADGNFIPATAQTDQSTTISSAGKPAWQTGSMDEARAMAALHANARAVDDPKFGPVVEWLGGGNGIELTEMAKSRADTINPNNKVGAFASVWQNGLSQMFSMIAPNVLGPLLTPYLNAAGITSTVAQQAVIKAAVGGVTGGLQGAATGALTAFATDAVKGIIPGIDPNDPNVKLAAGSGVDKLQGGGTGDNLSGNDTTSFDPNQQGGPADIKIGTAGPGNTVTGTALPDLTGGGGGKTTDAAKAAADAAAAKAAAAAAAAKAAQLAANQAKGLDANGNVDINNTTNGVEYQKDGSGHIIHDADGNPIKLDGTVDKSGSTTTTKVGDDAAKTSFLTDVINRVSAGGLAALTAGDLAKLAGYGITGAAILNQLTSGAKPSDIVAAATAQGQVNKDFQTATLQGSNPNINNPYGSQSITWNKDPVTGNMVPTVNQKYNADQQAILDNQTATKKADGLLALGAANRANTALSAPLDLSKAPALGGDYSNARQSVIDAYMSRANEDYNKATDNNQSNMIAAGIRPGSKAYGDQQQMTERARNDAYQQAEIAGGNAVAQANTTSLQNHQAGVTDILTARNQPITELNNLNATTNSAPAPLSFQSFSPAVVAAPNVQQATLDANNMQQQQTNNTTNGLLGLGKTLLTGP